MIKRFTNFLKDNIPFFSLAMLHFSLMKLFELGIVKSIWLGFSILSVFFIAAFLKYE